jgi:glycerophosphoryl diester phosphodiesterase
MNKLKNIELAQLLCIDRALSLATNRHCANAQPVLWGNGTKIVAHRGNTSLVKFENTLEAFQIAIEIGIPQIEFDLRMTQDGYLVCYHDRSIDGIKIKHLKYQELLTISRGKGFEIPLFEDILRLCQNRIALDIEIKEEGYEEQIVSLTTQYFGYSNFVMKSFNDSSVRKIKKLDPHIKVGILLGGISTKRSILRILSQFFPEYRIIKTGADFVAPNFRLLKFGFSWRMQLLDREIYVWTVNEESRLIKLIKNDRISAIITDKPELALQILTQIESCTAEDLTNY